MYPEEWWLALVSLARSGRRARELLREVERAGCPELSITAVIGAEPTDVPPARLVDWTWVRKVFEVIQRTDMRIVPYLSFHYPTAFRGLPRPPIVLFCRGRVDLLQERPSVAVVGTRRASISGLESARIMGAELARAGFMVVSGLAEGIDAAAHAGALEARGDTVAVLGCGPDVIYPRRNRDLQEEIAHRGLLMSEFPPGTEPRAAHFPQRNRLVSALAHGVVVVEAGERSGALITAAYARRRGKMIMAMPGAPGCPTSAGTNRLIKRGGARLIEGAEDVIQCLSAGGRPGSMAYRPVRKCAQAPDGNGSPAHPLLPGVSAGTGAERSGPTEAERAVLSLLSGRGVSADHLARATGRPVWRILAELLRLELQGLVEGTSGGTLWRRV